MAANTTETTATASAGATPPLDFFSDVPLLCTVSLGETLVCIRDFLSWRVGAIITLDKREGEALEVKANGNLIARGEAVVVNENFGVRLTEMVDPDASGF